MPYLVVSYLTKMELHLTALSVNKMTLKIKYALHMYVTGLM